MGFSMVIAPGTASHLLAEPKVGHLRREASGGSVPCPAGGDGVVHPPHGSTHPAQPTLQMGLLSR
jgi:hypothetical protein